MNYGIILAVSSLILISCNLLGNKIAKKLNLNDKIQYTSFGFVILMSFLFVFYLPLVWFKVNANIINLIFILIMIGLLFVSIIIKSEKISYHRKDLLLIVAYVVIMVILSTKVGLSEQTSDSNFYFTIVQRNINSQIVGQFLGYSGGIYNNSVIGIQYLYQSFYQFFSAILWLLNLLFKDVIMNSAVYMWVSNILFYFFSFEAILNVKNLTKNTSSFVVNIVFIGLYIQTLYYNITFPHVGVIFLTSLITNLIIILYAHFKDGIQVNPLVIIFYNIAMISCASSGFFLGFFMVYSYIMMSLFFNLNNILKHIFYLALPTLVYSIVFMNNLIFTIIVLLFELVLMLIAYLSIRKEHVVDIINKCARIMMLLMPIVFTILGIIKYQNSYLSVLSHFFAQHSVYDRVEDYLIFKGIGAILINSLYYCCLVALFLKSKTKKLAVMLVIIIITFANPLVLPFVMTYITGVEVYQRILYLVFSSGFIMIGIDIIIETLKDNKIVQKMLLIMIIAISSYYTYRNIRYGYHQFFKPTANFNVLYKLDQSVVDTGNALKYIIDDEKLYYPKVISQTEGLLIIEPRITLMNGMIEKSNIDDAYPNDPKMKELLSIFYKPLYPGDDQTRLTSKYQDVDNILEKTKIDFIIVDKSLHVLDKDNQWVPLYYFLLESCTIMYQNDEYVIFRYYH